MSKMLIELRDRENGFTEVIVDGDYCGQIEDVEDELINTLKRVLWHIGVENCEIIKRK